MKRSRSFPFYSASPAGRPKIQICRAQLIQTSNFTCAESNSVDSVHVKFDFLSLDFDFPRPAPFSLEGFGPSTLSSHLIRSPASLKQISDICLFMWRGVHSPLKSSIVSKRPVQTTILDKIMRNYDHPFPHVSDGKKNGALWLEREFIIDSGEGVVLFVILFCPRM